MPITPLDTIKLTDKQQEVIGATCDYLDDELKKRHNFASGKATHIPSPIKDVFLGNAVARMYYAWKASFHADPNGAYFTFEEK